MAQEDDHVTKTSVREYALSRNMQPQLVYYYIRTGKILEEKCICGRKVIDIVGADAFFKAKVKK
jgi:hypothetical protein